VWLDDATKLINYFDGTSIIQINGSPANMTHTGYFAGLGPYSYPVAVRGDVRAFSTTGVLVGIDVTANDVVLCNAETSAGGGEGVAGNYTIIRDWREIKAYINSAGSSDSYSPFNYSMRWRGFIDVGLQEVLYPASKVGDVYYILDYSIPEGSGGLIGGANGVIVYSGDLLICSGTGDYTGTVPEGNQVQVGTSWLIVRGLTSLPKATTELSGKVELATNAETLAGTDSERAVVPAGLAYVLTGYSLTSHTHAYVASTNGSSTNQTLLAWRETLHDLGDASGDVVINYSNGNVQRLTVAGNITNLSCSNFPANAALAGGVLVVLDMNTAYSVVWDSSISFGATGAPPLNQNKRYFINLMKIGTGATYYATWEGGY
jgi:hypothetical protein